MVFYFVWNLPTIHTCSDSINGLKIGPGVDLSGQSLYCMHLSLLRHYFNFIVSMTKSYPKCVVLIVECLARTEKSFSVRLFHIFMFIVESPVYF